MNRKRIAFLVVSITLMVTLLAGGVFGESISKDNIYRHLSIFTEIFSLVRSSYVEEVEPDALLAGAFDGLTDAIDEFSYYVPPAQMAAYRDYPEGETPGLGIVVSRRFGYGYVIAPIEGSPADAGGIEAGDFIEQIDGKPTQEMALWQIRSALHGQAGSKTELVILKGAMNKRQTVTLKREAFTAPKPAFETKEGVGYIRIPAFGASTRADLASALAQAKATGARQLILDVRENADGSIASAIESADLLLGKGTITALKGRKAEAKSWTADAQTAWSGDLLVLADTSSAAAAEVFAAAVRDNGAGRIVGTRTYGKAIEQKLVKLESGGALMVTIADYTSPKAAKFRGEGVKPDVLVDLTPLAIRTEEESKTKAPDLILQKALSILKSGDAQKNAA
ncbi:MAG TPA: S41 family peptidase [Thermoanaerobaculia bacterium]